MTTTRTPPSISDACTLPMARRMKSACWKAFVSIVTSAGSVRFRSASVFSICSVTSSVLAFGCF